MKMLLLLLMLTLRREADHVLLLLMCHVVHHPERKWPHTAIGIVAGENISHVACNEPG